MNWKKIIVRAGLGLLVVTVLIVGGLGVLSWLQQKPADLGVAQGRLRPCPQSSNCVCSEYPSAPDPLPPIPFNGSPEQAMNRIETIVSGMPRTSIISQSDNYLHAEFRSALFRFIDDAEFRIDPEASVIHFRSASRVGRSDLGANRERMRKIKQQFDSNDA